MQTGKTEKLGQEEVKTQVERAEHPSGVSYL